MRGVACDDQTRAAVMAALLAGQRVGEVAKQYGLPESTVSLWRKSIGGKYAEVCRKQTADFGDLLAGYLTECLTTLKAQVEFFRTESWLVEQRASEVAVLHGVIADKSLLLLRAAEDAAAANEGESP